MRENNATKNFRKIGEINDRIERIENVAGDGTLDFSCTILGREFWVECKAPTEPKRETTPLFGSNHDVTQEQQNWMLMHRNAGGKAFIYIETDQRRICICGSFADAINKMPLKQIILLSFFHVEKPAPKDTWGIMRNEILSWLDRQ